MDELIAFLKARLDAWERHNAEACRSTGESDEESATWGWVRADLADIDSKRRIIALCNLDFNDDGQPIYLGGYGEAYWDVLRLLALPYAGHRDYREEWKP